MATLTPSDERKGFAKSVGRRAERKSQSDARSERPQPEKERKGLREAREKSEFHKFAASYSQPGHLSAGNS